MSVVLSGCLVFFFSAPVAQTASAPAGGAGDQQDGWVGSYELYLWGPGDGLHRRGFLGGASVTWVITKAKKGYLVKGCAELEKSPFVEVKPGVLRNEAGVEIIRGTLEMAGDCRTVLRVPDRFRDGYLFGEPESLKKVRRALQQLEQQRKKLKGS